MKLRATFVAGTAAAALVLTACGGGAQRAASDDQTLAGGTTASLTRDNFVDQVGKAQREARSTHLEMTVETGGDRVEAEGDVSIGSSSDDSAMAVTMNLPGVGDVDARLVGGVFYLNLGPLSENKFATIDLDDPDDPMGRSLQGFAGQLDPAASLARLDGAITTFEKAGKPKRLDGVQAQPYKVVVDTAKAGMDKSDADKAGGTGSSSQVPAEVTATFWVGEDNLPRRIQTQVGGADVVVDLSQWGEEVDVEKPPADQITERDPFNGALPTPTP